MKYRIVNRTRFITFCVIIILTFSFLFTSVFSVSAAKDSARECAGEITVVSGDTLWSIAKEYAPSDMDIREAVFYLSRNNSIKNSEIFPGQVLSLSFK